MSSRCRAWIVTDLRADETNRLCYGSTTKVYASGEQVKSGSSKSKSGGPGCHPIIRSASGSGHRHHVCVGHIPSLRDSDCYSSSRDCGVHIVNFLPVTSRPRRPFMNSLCPMRRPRRLLRNCLCPMSWPEGLPRFLIHQWFPSPLPVNDQLILHDVVLRSTVQVYLIIHSLVLYSMVQIRLCFTVPSPPP